MKTFLKKYRSILALIGVVLLTIPLLLPFFHPGFFTSHDGEWTVVRLADMFRTVRDGQIPARYSSFLNMQYGYPLFNFAYPAPYYIGLVFVLLKFGFVNSIKLLFVLSTVASGIGMFLLSSRLWKSTLAGVVSAILFLYLPYRMVDLYVRGSLGETVALGVVPYLFLCLYLTVTKRSLLFAALTGGLLGFLIPSHNILSLLFTPLLLVFAVVLAALYKKTAWKEVAVAFILGIGLSSFFLIPAIAEKHLILLEKIPIADRSLYFVSPAQLILPSWGYGAPTDPENPFTYQLGIAQFLGFLLTLGVIGILWRNKKKRTADVRVVTALLVFAIAALLLLFSFSRPVWELTPLLSEINYPWTLLAPIGFLLSLSVGYIATIRRYRYLLVALAMLSVITVIPYARPASYINRGDDFYLTNMATTTSSHEYTPLWVRDIPQQTYADKVEVTQGNARVSDTRENSSMISFAIEATDAARFRINTIYYPGRELQIDGEKSWLTYDNLQGVMEGEVSPGRHTVRAVFSETPLRITANTLTMISFLVIVTILAVSLFKRTDEKA